jgi:hypothetical protein
MFAGTSGSLLMTDQLSNRMLVRLGALAVVSIVGCGGGDFPTAPVSGRVTYNGAPVSNATVFFAPQAGEGRDPDMPGKTAYGTTDASGNFTLSTYGDGDGAVIGSHVVSVRLNPDPDTGEERHETFPGRDKTVQVTVEDGNNEIDIQL